MNKNFALLGAAVLSLGLVACDQPADQVEEGDTVIVTDPADPEAGVETPEPEATRVPGGPGVEGPVPHDN